MDIGYIISESINKSIRIWLNRSAEYQVWVDDEYASGIFIQCLD